MHALRSQMSHSAMRDGGCPLLQTQHRSQCGPGNSNGCMGTLVAILCEAEARRRVAPPARSARMASTVQGKGGSSKSLSPAAHLMHASRAWLVCVGCLHARQVAMHASRSQRSHSAMRGNGCRRLQTQHRAQCAPGNSNGSIGTLVPIGNSKGSRPRVVKPAGSSRVSPKVEVEGGIVGTLVVKPAIALAGCSVEVAGENGMNGCFVIECGA